tara:strand:+ start:84 stop:1118 length:1035 start_codon:yes stop_codon:yes gene_type:complete
MLKNLDSNKIKTLKRMKAYPKSLLFFMSLLMLSFLFQSCDNEKDIDLSTIKIETDIKRFDRAFFTMDTLNFTQNLAALEQDYPPFFSAKTEEVFWRNQRKDELQLKLFSQTEKLFGDMEKEQAELNQIFKRFYYYFGQEKQFEVYSYISRLDYDYPIIVAPPYCFIGLDMYLGENNDYYASLPNYLQFERQAQFLLRDVAFALAENTFGLQVDENKLLNAMIYYGKLLYVTEKLCPFLREDELMVYPPMKMEFCEEHERDMWVYFIENGVLFKSDAELQRRFIDVAPFSKFRTDTDPQTPGGVGRWFGYKIVSAYMEENPDLSLKQLLQEQDAAKILKLSNYKP